jgi:hypothetical protein
VDSALIYPKLIKNDRLQPRFSGLEKGIYGVYHNSELCEIYNIDDRMDTIELSLQVSGDDYDLVILQG